MHPFPYQWRPLGPLPRIAPPCIAAIAASPLHRADSLAWTLDYCVESRFSRQSRPWREIVAHDRLCLVLRVPFQEACSEAEIGGRCQLKYLASSECILCSCSLAESHHSPDCLNLRSVFDAVFGGRAILFHRCPRGPVDGSLGRRHLLNGFSHLAPEIQSIDRENPRRQPKVCESSRERALEVDISQRVGVWGPLAA